MKHIYLEHLITSTSYLHLTYISPIPHLHLIYITPTPDLHFTYTLPTAHLLLIYTSPTAHLHLIRSIIVRYVVTFDGMHCLQAFCGSPHRDGWKVDIQYVFAVTFARTLVWWTEALSSSLLGSVWFEVKSRCISGHPTTATQPVIGELKDGDRYFRIFPYRRKKIDQGIFWLYQ